MTVTAAEYHGSTSYHRNRMSGHVLDWSNQPKVFKAYIGQELLALPDDRRFSPASLWDVLFPHGPIAHPSGTDLFQIARILVLTHTITAKARYGGTDFFYRSVASAGALYPSELYVAALDVQGLSPGVYHYQPASRTLAVLRRGWPGYELSRLAPKIVIEPVSVVFFISSIFFRSAWKYRERAYRYHLLDSGHILENLTLALKSEGLRFSLSFDFDDMGINEFLGFDKDREACLATVAAIHDGQQPKTETPQPLDLPGPHLPVCSRVSPREIQYPAIKEIHQASSQCKRAVAQPDVVKELGMIVDSWLPLPQLGEPLERMSLHESLMKRRSMRNFVRASLPLAHLSLLLETVCANDMPQQVNYNFPESIAVGFLTGNVEGLRAGFYIVNRQDRSFGLVRPGFFVPTMAHICLDQEWLANCALHFLFLTNLSTIESTYGPRGYRYAMLEAGRLGQRLYLATTAIRIGCCGIGAFYDSEAAELLGLRYNCCLLYLVAAGPVRKWIDPMKPDKQ